MTAHPSIARTPDDPRPLTSDDPSRPPALMDADDVTLDQVRKQLAKLVATVEVRDFAGTAYIERDLALVTVTSLLVTRRGQDAGGAGEAERERQLQR